MPIQKTEAGLILGSGRSSGGGNGSSLEYSCLKKAWTEKPGGLQSIGSQRVRHNFRDIAYLALVP